ncbi:MAG: hypothetical protein QXD66_03920 [Candidatus Nezhaarchaeales archaeon]|nr:MAG: hypothetical protein DSO06_02665 [Candidatus Nezhaarchaeota archaeon WYZ-LMO8]TDA35642.1 MAG: hypothetical protein DSO05_05040 [Candidatus Nezhaarchaeota archaeon WYZ-LMO7]
MKVSGEDLRKALIALSFGLEPVIFAIVGWYAGPYLKLTNVMGALIGVIVGFGIMFWRIWKFSLTLGLKVKYDPERENLRSLISLVEVERYKIMNRYDIARIMGARGSLQLLNVLKNLSLIELDFYDLIKLNDVLDEITDFSKVLIDIRIRSPIELLKVMDDFNDFIVTLCANFAFRYEVYGDEVARGYVVTPFKLRRETQSLLREDLKDYLASDDIRGLYPKALEEALTIGSRGPLLALAAYSLLKIGKDLEVTKYAYVYSNEIRELAYKLFSIAIDDLRREDKKSMVVEVVKQKIEENKVLLKREEGVAEKEEEVLRNFINNAYRSLREPSRVPLTAKAVLSYLFVKWSEKVSLKLAFMVVNNEVTPQKAYESLVIPY